jgi:hypothetical protein
LDVATWLAILSEKYDVYAVVKRFHMKKLGAGLYERMCRVREAFIKGIFPA